MAINLYTPRYRCKKPIRLKSDTGYSVSENIDLVDDLYSLSTREELVSHYVKDNPQKDPALRAVVEFVNRHKISSILSIGSGPCVMEHLLWQMLGGKVEIAAVDHDGLLIKKAKEFFPHLHTSPFDLYEDRFEDLYDFFESTFDLIIFFGSSYVMDEQKFIEVFRNLRQQVHLRYVMDFHAGCLPITRYFLSSLKQRFIAKKPGLFFHGYGRTARQVERNYRRAGFNQIERRGKIGCYPYVSILAV